MALADPAETFELPYETATAYGLAPKSVPSSAAACPKLEDVSANPALVVVFVPPTNVGKPVIVWAPGPPSRSRLMATVVSFLLGGWRRR